MIYKVFKSTPSNYLVTLKFIICHICKFIY
nr:MAG TPA: hypothetical protein [Caudoviricetes sp.]